MTALAAVVVTAIYAFFTIRLWQATKEQATITRLTRVVQHLYQRRQSPVIDDTLPGGRGVEVSHVDDAGQPGILSRDSSEGIGERLPQAGRDRGYLPPASTLRDVEADELVVLLDERRRDLAIAELMGKVVAFLLLQEGSEFCGPLLGILREEIAPFGFHQQVQPLEFQKHIG